jgi:nitrate/nitrite-specific signal transduction histidine kinase
MTESRDKEAYVLRIWEETRKCTRELIAENRTLRELAARFEVEAQQAGARAEWLEQQLESFRKRRAELEGRLESLEKESRERLRSYLDLEQQNTNLANLYVASYRLHATLDRAEVLAGIQEIIINLVGSEELAIFEVRNGDRVPRVAARFGVPFESFSDVPREAQKAILAAMESGKVAIGAHDGADPRPVACIPLGIEGRPIGAIAVFRLLQQKQGIETLDRELFDLLATHAATALYATRLHQAAPAEVA